MRIVAKAAFWLVMAKPFKAFIVSQLRLKSSLEVRAVFNLFVGLQTSEYCDTPRIIQYWAERRSLQSESQCDINMN